MGALIAGLVGGFGMLLAASVAPAGWSYWMATYGSKPDANLDVVSDSFALSREFQLRYGTLSDTDFVNLIYRNVLGRTPDAGGLAHWAPSRVAKAVLLRRATASRAGEHAVEIAESALFAEKGQYLKLGRGQSYGRPVTDGDH